MFLLWSLSVLTCLERSGVCRNVKGIGGRGTSEGDDGLELAGLGCRGGGGQPGEGRDNRDDLEGLHFCDLDR